jgi:glutaryl-CoA dehydrogenase
MASEISKAQLLSLHVGRLKDAGTVGHQHISMAKRNNVWMALECARLARDILGANGITGRLPHHAPHDESGVREDLRRHSTTSTH